MATLSCPPTPVHTLPTQPSTANLTYSFSLPGGAYCASFARRAVRHLLHAHGLSDMTEPAELTVSELLGSAYRFTPDWDVSLAVRWRYDELRQTVFDSHPAHREKCGDTCATRRRAGLKLLDAVMDACGGRWDVADAGAPLGGTKLWAAFPRQGGRRYARL